MTKSREIPIGEVFGCLTILRFDSFRTSPSGEKTPKVVCSCSCGAEKVVDLRELRRGRGRTHCGNFKIHPRKSRGVDYRIGERYGKLLVKEAAPTFIATSGRESIRVLCDCDCGVSVVVGLGDIRSGKTTTCGAHPLYEDRSLPAFNNLFNHTYKSRALKSGKVFEITEEQFRELTKQDCFYCGSEPQSRSIRSGKYTSEYAYNGLDRVDNSVGYTLNNVVPCCFDCNHAKATLTQSAFLSLARKIVAKHGTSNLV
jgi:hypothetical protein